MGMHIYAYIKCVTTIYVIYNLISYGMLVRGAKYLGDIMRYENECFLPNTNSNKLNKY